MTFFDQPILNSPYVYPSQHWEIDNAGQPTGRITYHRRSADFMSPIPRPRKRNGTQGELFAERDLAHGTQQYQMSQFINSLRQKLDDWRRIPNPRDWRVSPETARLLQHWRSYDFQGVRPFFCQIEAVETAIWLAEVAPNLGRQGEQFLEQLRTANENANPELFRIALKLATGAGKTTVMSMLIAWQTVNAVRYPQSDRFSKGFLIITPGITIRDRLQVLQPNHPDNYYRTRDIVPLDMMADIVKAKIVITNYHAFRLRERVEIASGTRKALAGHGDPLDTKETSGQMIQRVMSELMGLKNLVVINDEAHHCYRALPSDDKLTGDDKAEADQNNETARLWITGIETIKAYLKPKKIENFRVYDLSATPFFLNGSGYAEGTLFPWVVSDFSLMDAIECGIVKLPRVPISDNIPEEDMPRFRKLWDTIRTRMPKKTRGKDHLDPLSLPTELQSALDALYGHYQLTYGEWQRAGIPVPPVFIVVCNNTSTSKLVFDYISGFFRPDGTYHAGRFELFRNFDDNGDRISRPRTFLIDSEQLESGDAMDDAFKEVASDEIERFRKDLAKRKGAVEAQKITDQDLLREVMNTVGKVGKLGESIRCVVSVSMLTEGWDTNTVTHVLGVRAFSTQLLCEQVVGRALRRYSYQLNEQGLYDVEYADVLGIPFTFNARPVPSKVKTPRITTHIFAVSPDRDSLVIEFPRVSGYRVELPQEKLTAKFTADSVIDITPSLVGASITKCSGIVGESIDLTLEHLDKVRLNTVVYELTKHLLFREFRDPNEEPKLYLFGQLKKIVSEWVKDCLVCKGGTFPAQVLYQEMADMACERIKSAISEAISGDRPIKAILDPFSPTGSSSAVNIQTTKQTLWTTDPRKCHVNYVVWDSSWESEFCRVAEAHPRVVCYVKNHALGFEVPYLFGSTPRKYIPDFIVKVNDGRDDLLNLVVEIKGFRGEDAKDKANTIRNYWVEGINNLGNFGRWAFAEFTESAFDIDERFSLLIESYLTKQPVST